MNEELDVRGACSIHPVSGQEASKAQSHSSGRPATRDDAHSMPDTSQTALAMRAGLRRLAKAVVVITCQHGGARYAMTATAVSELSMEPPSLLICVNRSASLHAPLAAKAGFCVNILHRAHADISALCSGKAKGEARFALGRWLADAGGTPYLADAQASFLCRHEQSLDYGTHSIVIGLVEKVLIHGSVDPLVYMDGTYGHVCLPAR
jgi:flavin reductase (DIM6/NTAB) family NADH-FMN oxidoreductase RutF